MKYDRFKTTLNTYFQQRKEYFQQIKETQTQNYNLKLNLTISQALVDRTDWRRATEEIIQLQKSGKYRAYHVKFRCYLETI